MRITRRGAAIGASALALATAGALAAGPAFARDSHHGRVQASGQYQVVDSSTATLPSLPGMPGMQGRGFGDRDGFPGRGHGRGHGRMGAPGQAFGPMLHSTGVVQQTESGTATYVTVSQQEGKVTAASDTQLTVQSADGVSWTWTLTATTHIMRNGTTVTGSAFQVGDVVEVMGTGNGSGSTAVVVMSHAPRPRPANPGAQGGSGTLAPLPTPTTGTNA